MMEQQCPECGSRELGVGKWTGMANLQPVGKLNLKGGSVVLVTLCTECGYILSMKVKEPHIFKSD